MQTDIVSKKAYFIKVGDAFAYKNTKGTVYIRIPDSAGSKLEHALNGETIWGVSLITGNIFAIDATEIRPVIPIDVSPNGRIDFAFI